MKDVFFVILNLNNLDVIKPLYESLIKHDDYPKNLVFIDNGSHQDLSREYLRGICENNIYNHYIELPDNVGASRGFNIGIEYIRKNFPNAGYIGFINSDITVEDGWLKPMINVFEANINNPGMASNQLRDPGSKMFIQNDGPNLERNLHYRMGIEGKTIFPYRENTQVEYGHMGCTLFKKEVFDRIGLFDENMFVYSSDFDIQVRLKLAGYSIWHCPRSIAYHKTFHTCNQIKSDPEIQERCENDGLYFFNKYTPDILDNFKNHLNYWDCNEKFLRNRYNKSPERINKII